MFDANNAFEFTTTLENRAILLNTEQSSFLNSTTFKKNQAQLFKQHFCMICLIFCCKQIVSFKLIRPIRVRAGLTFRGACGIFLARGPCLPYLSTKMKMLDAKENRFEFETIKRYKKNLNVNSTKFNVKHS